MIHLMLIDDHKIFRDGLKSIFESEANFKIVGEADDGREALNLLQEIETPHVVLMDISLNGDIDGLTTTQLFKEQLPEVKILILSMHNESSYIVKALELGASGYLLKNTGKQEMIRGILTVKAGDNYFSSTVSSKLLDFMKNKNKKKNTDIPLTKREIEVLRHIADEYSNAEIAEKLFISIRTVDAHRRNLLEKLGVKNTAGLVKYAMRNKLLEE